MCQTERVSYRLQQAQSQERQEEAALGVQGRPEGRRGQFNIQHKLLRSFKPWSHEECLVVESIEGHHDNGTYHYGVRVW